MDPFHKGRNWGEEERERPIHETVRYKNIGKVGEVIEKR